MDKKALIKALRDTVQSASNTVASGVSAPIDLIAAGLRKVGMPIPQAPVGGSQWMENMGLTVPVKDGIPKLAGETLGMIVPMAATAKAPQIASAANRGLENLAMPRTLNTPAFQGQRGAIYAGDKLTSNIDDANEFAQKIRNLGAQYRPNIIEDAGGSVYVTVDKLPLTKSGAVAKNRTPMPTNFKARFADHPQYWGASISSDPITQNTAEDAYQLFAHEILGQQAPETITKAFFVPQDKVGKITEKTLKTMPSLSGKSMVQKYIEETRPFTFYEPKLSNQPMGLMGAPKQTGLQELTTLNPTGSISVNYDPISRAIAPLGKNITTLDKTMGGFADDIVTIYRGAPKTQKTIKPGDFITTNAQLARDYAGTGHVISQKVRKKDILDDMLEPLGEEYIYRPAK